MAISVGSNIFALAAIRRLGDADSAISDAFLRLSSGMRINRPSDDAAGLAVASTLNVQGRIFNRALANANDGISMLNVAQGSTQQLSSILMRMKELAEQAANGSLSSSQRSSLNSEAQKLAQEYNRLINSSQFNGLTIHAADQGQTNLQIGTGTGGMVGFELGDALESSVGSGKYQTHSSINDGAAGDAVQSVDLDGDGNLDMLSLSRASNKLSYRYGNGDGTFGKLNQVSISSDLTYSMVTGDIDNDGDIDVLVSSNKGTVNFMKNAGTALTASLQYQLDPGTNPISQMRLADMNGDGNLDLVSTANYAIGGMAYLAIGNGDGTFAARQIVGAINGLQSSAIDVGDFNGDGRVDIVVNNASASTVLVYLNTMTGKTASFSNKSVAGFASNQQVKAADMNGDGYDDLVIGQSTSIRTILSNGNGTFASGTTLATGTSLIDQIDVKDLNSDGMMDVVIVDTTTRVISTLLGNGNGTYQTRKDSSIGSSGLGAAVADVNSDGIYDVIVGSATGETIYSGLSMQATTLNSFNILTQSSALSALTLFDSQLTKVGNELGKIGAALSRIESAAKVVGATAENYAAAEGRITNIDVAEETARLARNKILQQSAAAVLAQANQSPQLALQFLKFN